MRAVVVASLLALLVCAAGARGEAPAAPDRAAMERLSSEVMREVAALRGLAVERPVAVEIATREEILAYVDKRLAETGELERLSLVGRLWRRIGLLEVDDLAAELRAAYVSQIAGYYDFERDTYVVADWIPMELQRPVMSHELVHALQDQHFDIHALMEPVPGNQDLELARGALLEGDAFDTMLEHSLGRSVAELGDLVALTQLSMAMGGAEAAGMALPEGLPRVLREIMLFPYVYGGTFLQDARAGGGWKAVDGAYADPPRTTEQILHPEKYWRERDEPRIVSLDAVQKRLGLPRPVAAETLGQFLTFLWLGGRLSEQRAAAAASGWDGDLAAIHGEPGRETVLVSSVWDGPGDALEAATAILELAGRDGLPGAAPALGTPFATSRGPVLVAVAGDEVTFVLGPPGAVPASLAKALPAPGKAR